MCAFSEIANYINEIFPKIKTDKQIRSAKWLLKAAQEFDIENNEPDCGRKDIVEKLFPDFYN